MCDPIPTPPHPQRSVTERAGGEDERGCGLCAGAQGLSQDLILHLFPALAVTFRPDGAELAVATLNSQITFWDPENAVQTGSIEGRHDLKTGRKELDKVTAKHSAKGK